jgi:hypothetical protein
VVPTTIAKGVAARHRASCDGDTNTNVITGTTTLEALAESQGFVLAAPQGITQDISIGDQIVNGVDWGPLSHDRRRQHRHPPSRRHSHRPRSERLDRHEARCLRHGGYMSFRYGMDTSATLSCTGLIGAANPLRPQLTASATRKIPVALKIRTNDTQSRPRGTRRRIAKRSRSRSTDACRSPAAPWLAYRLGQKLP